MTKIEYATQEEMNNIITEQTAKGLYLIEIQNVINGNFLIFDTQPVINDGVNLTDRVTSLELAVNQILLGGI